MIHNSDIATKIIETAILVRRVEERVASEYQNQQMRCPVHLSIGQEFTSAIFSAAHKPGDTALSTHRAHAHYLAMGGNLNRMIAEIYGKATGCSRGRGGSMHLVDLDVGFLGSSAIVGNSIPVGVGVGMSHKLNRSGAVCFVFLGDGAIEEGVFYESANFAALHKIPIVFICENNFYSVYTNLQSRQPLNRTLTDLVSAIGILSKKITSKNPNEALHEMEELVAYARSGSGPVFIEIETYRYVEHCGPNSDDNLNYRPAKEIIYWRENDFVDSIPEFAKTNNIDTDTLAQIENFILLKIDKAFSAAKNDPFPSLSDTLIDTYAGEEND
jgi:TPP-dependent pyruvate/acetoin dehydrogenase alpha subunit